ncbi:hypothetical protein GCM10007424_06410 [Flavobacterium suaedae]|uniref:Outer membrane beta-barrel protein n=1 Tax=Flavobacterium suaedae TaxID=1767027 RepID=A0ABQ1JLV4_9FLAO|nr:hypothetical protein [Flavobacterium suaedae]GGB69165.1 hypothetical protein GCM10007424_06410 [Flavobacterium suaedae]
MKSVANFLFTVILLMSFSCFSQNKKKPETVFITSSEPREKKKEKEGRGFIPFTQLAINMSVRGNPEGNDGDGELELSDFIIPDGLEGHFGYGYLYNSWLGLSANTGVDTSSSDKLVAVPVYAMLTFTVDAFDDSSIIAQAGLGHSFAIGRGNLSGTYQKYRLGLVVGEFLAINLDVSLYGFNPDKENINQVGNFSIGISLLKLFEK